MSVRSSQRNTDGQVKGGYNPGASNAGRLPPLLILCDHHMFWVIVGASFNPVPETKFPQYYNMLDQ